MKKTILIAEDNEINMKLMRDILKSQGYDILEAYDGEQAIDLAIENKKTIDLVLMDIQLPKLSGLDAIKALKENKGTKNLLIFVVSAHAMSKDIENAKKAGCIEYITKPINLVEFINKVNSYLQS